MWGAEGALPNWGGGVQPGRSGSMPRGRTPPPTWQRCLYPPFPKGKNPTFWGSCAVLPRGEPGLSLELTLNPTTTTTSANPTTPQYSAIATPVLSIAPPLPPARATQAVPPTLSHSSPPPREGDEHLPDHAWDIPDKTNWASIPPCPCCWEGRDIA